MKSKIMAVMLVGATVTFAGSAFASGYGPAPFYHPDQGAPSSQRGQSAQTIASEQQNQQ